MKNNQFVKKMALTTTTILVWSIVSFLMSIIFYKLFALGFIWNNSDKDGEFPWNTRKVIFFVIGLASFIQSVIVVVNIWSEDE